MLLTLLKGAAAGASVSGEYTVRRRHQRQPQLGLEVDWSNPLTRDLRFMYIGSVPIDLVTGQVATVVGTADKRSITSLNGPASGPNIDGTSYLDFGTRESWNTTGRMTLFWRGVVDATTGAFRCPISKANSGGGTTTPFDCYIDQGSGEILCIRSNTNFHGFKTLSGAVAGSVNTFAFIAGTEDISTAPLVALNSAALQTASFATSNGGTGLATGNTRSIRVGRRDDGATQLDGAPEVTMLWARSLSAEEYARVYSNPYALLKPARKSYPFAFGAAAGITATSAQNLAQFLGTSSTAVRVSGTSAQTLAAITGSTSAAVAVSATSLATLAQFVGTTTTAVRVTGTSAATLAALAGTASTAVSISGTSAITLGGLLASANGIVGAAPAIGTSTITLAAFSSSSSAAVRVTATAAIDLSAFAGAASGALGAGPRVGTSAALLTPFIGFTVGAVTGTPVVNTAGAITGGRSGITMNRPDSTNSARPRAGNMRRPRMN